jgi:hypothetical protein
MIAIWILAKMHNIFYKSSDNDNNKNEISCNFNLMPSNTMLQSAL